MERKTIARPNSLRGAGVWTGEQVEVTCVPAEAGEGAGWREPAGPSGGGIASVS